MPDDWQRLNKVHIEKPAAVPPYHHKSHMNSLGITPRPL